MLYSVYALYASGGDAVMGGMLVMGVTYIIWGFISNRFTARHRPRPARRSEGTKEKSHDQQEIILSLPVAAPACFLRGIGLRRRRRTRPHPRQRPRAPCLSTRQASRSPRASASGTAGGLWRGAVRADRRAGEVAAGDCRSSRSTGCAVHPTRARHAVARGHADLLCTPSNATLAAAQDACRSRCRCSPAAFAPWCATMSPVRCATRSSSSPTQRPRLARLARAELIEQPASPRWRAPSSESWLAAKVASFKLNTATMSVPDYASGIKFLHGTQDRRVPGGTRRGAGRAGRQVAQRTSWYSTARSPTSRWRWRCRAATTTSACWSTRALTAAYNSPEFPTLYVKYFGKLDDAIAHVLRWVTPP